MGENTKIQWAHHTFNPWRGCTKVAPGCSNCYADQQSKRNPKTLGIWGPNGTRVVAAESMWREPVKWNREAGQWRFTYDSLDEIARRGYATPERPRVFCASLADVFEDWSGPIRDAAGHPLHHASAWKMPGVWTGVANTLVGKSIIKLDDVRGRLFRLIDSTPNLDWLLLTKRPENVRRMIGYASDRPKVGTCTQDDRPTPRRGNLWLGTSIACQEDADRNIPELLKCRDLADKLFLSIEPMVGPVDLSPWLHFGRCNSRGGGGMDRNGRTFVYRCGLRSGHGGSHSALVETSAEWFGKPSLDWVIVGGESGPDARSCDVAWIRHLVRQCKDAGVPVFVKQLGAFVTTVSDRDEWPGGNGLPAEGVLRFESDGEGTYRVNGLADKKGGDPAEWPEDLRVREVPA